VSLGGQIPTLSYAVAGVWVVGLLDQWLLVLESVAVLC